MKLNVKLDNFMDPTWQGLVFTLGVHSFSFFIINFIFKKL